MLGKVLFCAITILACCEATNYLGGYTGKYGVGGIPYGSLAGYNGLGRLGYAYGNAGLPYTVGAVKSPYAYPADAAAVDPASYGLYYDGYGSNYGALYSSPLKYGLGYYGNYGYPVKK